MIDECRLLQRNRAISRLRCSKQCHYNELLFFDVYSKLSALLKVKVLSCIISRSRSQMILSIFGRPFVKRFALCYRTVVLSVCLSVCLDCLSCLSVTLVYCGQTVGWIKVPLGAEVGLGPRNNVSDGDAAPPRKGAQQILPTFRPMSIVAKQLDGSGYRLVRR